MAQTYSEGEVVTVTAPAGGYANGQLTVINGIPGVALNAATSGTKVAMAVEGVFEVACATTGTAAIGTRAFYKTVTGTVKKAVFVATGNATGVTGARVPTIGIVWEAKTSGATRTTIPIKLVGGPMPLLKAN